MDGLNQAVEILDGKIKFSETERQEIIEKIGEASGRDVKIRRLGEQAIEQATQEAEESWNKWQEELKFRLTQKSQNWNSLHHPVFSQEKLIHDYITCFTSDLVSEIDCWREEELSNSILKRHIKLLNAIIKPALEFEVVKTPFEEIDQQITNNLYKRINLFETSTYSNFVNKFLSGVAASLPSFIMSTILKTQHLFTYRILIVDFCFQNFETLKNKLFENLHKIVKLAIDNKIQENNQFVEQVILLHENFLEQQDKVHHATLEQRNAKKVRIAQKCEELKQLQIKIDKEYS